jgi:hypothetical protein
MPVFETGAFNHSATRPTSYHTSTSVQALPFFACYLQDQNGPIE